MIAAGARLSAAALAVLLAHPAAGQWDLSGEIDLEGDYASSTADSLDAALGYRDAADGTLRVRLMAKRGWDSGWGVDLAYLVEGADGGGVALARELHALYPDLYRDPERVAPVRLQWALVDSGQSYATQGLDRLILSHTSDHLVLRLGRQALTWGSGLVFHPLDLFNPFAPDATYTAYKPGTDMLYGQWLFDSGADVQAVIVPRRAIDTDAITADASSAGLKWHGFAGDDQRLGVDLLLAQDYGDQVLALGLSGPLGGATWSAELESTHLTDGGWRISALANLQYAWTWGERNVNAYLELFRNGFGVGGDGNVISELPPDLTERIARGQLFTVSREYLAGGLDLQWTPLLDLQPTLIANLDDGSVQLVGQAIYSLSQDTRITAGFQLGIGGNGTEYGGLETDPGSGVYVAPADQVYLRLTWYL